MSTFSDLPVEIVGLILSYVPVTPAQRPHHGFVSICLVNRRINAIATPLLYQTLVLEYSMVLGFPAKSLRGFFLPNHRGIKHVRQLKIRENSKLNNLGEDYSPYRVPSTLLENVKSQMSLMIYLLFREIGEDQLLSLSIDDARILSWFDIKPQSKLRHLNVDAKAFSSWHSNLRQSLGLVSVGRRGLSRDDGPADQLRKFADKPINRLHSISLSHIANEDALVGLAGIILSHYASLRAIDIRFNRDLISCSARDKDWIDELGDRFNLYYGINLPEYDFQPLNNLESISIKGFKEFDYLVKRLPSMLSVSKVKNLRLIGCSSSDTLMSTMGPKLENLTRLHLILSCGVFIVDRLLIKLKPILQSLHLVFRETAYFPAQSAILHHVATLETLWVDIRSSRGTRYPLDLVDQDPEHKVLDWWTVTNMFSLKEFATVMAPGVLGDLRPSRTLKVLRILNYQEKHKILAHSIVASMFGKGWNNDPPPLKLLAFGEFSDGSYDEKKYRLYHIDLLTDSEPQNRQEHKRAQTKQKKSVPRMIQAINLDAAEEYTDDIGYWGEPAADKKRKPSLAPVSLERAKWMYPNVAILEAERRDEGWLK